MGTILSYLEVMYNVKVNTVSDYLRLLKKTEHRPADTFLALAAIREQYDAPAFRFRPTFSIPLSSKVESNVVEIEDEYFRYTYVVEETTKPFVYLQDIRKKKDLEVAKTKIRKPDYFESNNDLLILLNRSNRTPYEDYMYALLLINAGTMPFFYALPFPPSREIKKVVFDDNIIRVFAPEERDIVILGESIESSSFTFAVVK
ncbi:hypothetical protein AVT97_gp45 [Sulfolobales Virus YNP2]|uniref:hypothetical protein n=1 Tax=Sulfolobales Virus YNP2 TaxID=1732180 RepID=UPI00070673A1|nr:hypothetical protein AVT97_gp45 [Sulfolobales Virus YNP2]ALG97208.1 hypothetical protein [Sulfolobales Virus YNP2]